MLANYYLSFCTDQRGLAIRICFYLLSFCIFCIWLFLIEREKDSRFCFSCVLGYMNKAWMMEKMGGFEDWSEKGSGSQLIMMNE